jgi:hypothetical protein
MLLRVAQVICTCRVCVGADAVDGLRGVVCKTFVWNVEVGDNVKRSVSMHGHSGRPERPATCGGHVDLCVCAG